MKIELYLDGEKKLFTTPFVPMLAKRKFLEIESKIEQNEEPLTKQQMIDYDDDMLSILSDVIFKNQFTLEQLYEGASREYVDEKIIEAIYGVKPKKKEGEEGNDQGE